MVRAREALRYSSNLPAPAYHDLVGAVKFGEHRNVAHFQKWITALACARGKEGKTVTETVLMVPSLVGTEGLY
jgi:hypothetical protein